jgi:endoglucanase
MRFSLLGLILAVGVLTACSAPSADTAFVRVDQVGYAPGEVKHAYLMSPADPGATRFDVVDSAGKVALTGTAGRSTGSWSDGFGTVRVLDVSALKTPDTYRIQVAGAASSPAFRIAPPATLFGPIATANLRFFGAQRDTAHRNDRQATVYATPNYNEDGTELLDERLTPVGGPVDVSGGWADAGDFLKFTHTAAYSTAALLLTQRDSGTDGADGTEARYGMDWLDRMWDDRTGTLYAQVGIGAGNDRVHSDHDTWRLPESDEAPGADPDLAHRPVFRAAEPGAPISPNLAGKVAAAFALSAQLDTGDSARRKLDKAAKLYDQADREPGELVTAFPHAFYPEASWQDDLEFAAAELALAGKTLGDPRTDGWTRDAERWAAEYLASDTRGTLGVGDVSALAHADTIRLGSSTKDDLVRDLARQLDDGRARAAGDPFRAGASYTDFDSVPHTFGLAATAHLYRRVTGSDTYGAFGAQQRNWVLGANAWGSSFVIGAGTVFPECPEHQGANLRDETLTGAVVNGPNKADKFAELNRFPTMKTCSVPEFARFDGHGARYVDDVGAWQSVEPADDFTATALLYFGLAARG